MAPGLVCWMDGTLGGSWLGLVVDFWLGLMDVVWLCPLTVLRRWLPGLLAECFFFFIGLICGPRLGLLGRLWLG
jgi:hypothetical protein